MKLCKSFASIPSYTEHSNITFTLMVNLINQFMFERRISRPSSRNKENVNSTPRNDIILVPYMIQMKSKNNLIL